MSEVALLMFSFMCSLLLIFFKYAFIKGQIKGRATMLPYCARMVVACDLLSVRVYFWSCKVCLKWDKQTDFLFCARDDVKFCVL